LVNSQFKIKFLEPTSVNACANNVLYPLYETKAGVQSDDRVLDFTIGASSGATADFQIDGLTIEATVSTCELIRTLEFYNPQTSAWEEWKPNDYSDMSDFYDANSARFPGFTLSPTQTNYADGLVRRFMTGPSITLAGYVPESLQIEFRIITQDATNEDETSTTKRYVDNFVVKISSNGETISDGCASEFANLSIQDGTAMFAPITYSTNANEPREYRVTSVFSGLDNLSW
jgi:hypothetical protein